MGGASSSACPSGPPPLAKPSMLEKMLRGLAASTAVRPLLEAHLGEALIGGGQEAFRAACDEVRSLSAHLWDLPLRRLEVLTTMLDVEMRCCSSACLARGQPESAQVARWMSGLFEDILSSMKDG